jgi:hypothetical protein
VRRAWARTLVLNRWTPDGATSEARPQSTTMSATATPALSAAVAVVPTDMFEP